MKFGKRASGLGVLLLLGLMLVSVVYAQGPEGEQSEGGIGAEEIGPSGLADPPPLGGFKELYLFTGVYNQTTDPEFATVAHCTNHGSGDVDILVQFFGSSPTDPLDFIYAYETAVSSNDTMTFSSQDVGSFTNEEFALITKDIQHGSGRVLVTDSPDTKVICTIQALALDSSDVPSDTAKLHLFDSDGNLIDDNSDPPNPGNDGIFMPIIFKNS